MSLKLDLRGDFYKYVENEVEKLKTQGFIFLENEKNVSYIAEFFNLMERIPEPKPRKILKAKTFICPNGFQKNLKNLEDKIEKGKPLINHLSKSILNADYSDGMLYDFGITHLHLGIERNTDNPNFIERTGEILYCVFTDDKVFFLTIDNHGRWNDIELVNILKENFPELLEKHRLNVLALCKEVTNGERKKFRKHNIYPLMQIDNKVYSSLGGGVMLNGFSRRGMLKAINQLKYLDYLETEANQIYEDNKKEIISKLGNIEEAEFNYKEYSNPLILYEKDSKYRIEIIWNPENYNDVSMNFEKND